MKIPILFSLKSTFSKIMCLFFLLLSFSSNTFSQELAETITGIEISDDNIQKGSELYNQKCKACHMVDKKLVGPALGYIHEKYEMDWLIKWIKDSPGLVFSGDKLAIEAAEYSPTAMTSFPELSDDDVKKIVMYLENESLKFTKEAIFGEPVIDPDTILNIGTYFLLLLTLMGIIIYIAKRFIKERHFKTVVRVNLVTLILVFFVGMGFIFYELSIHGKYVLISNSASEHGQTVDFLMIITMILTGFVFLVMQALLFFFAFKYRAKEGRKAFFYPVNDKLEIVWTIIPAIVLTLLVFGGFRTWVKITAAPDPENQQIEIFAYQFGWKARYPGLDNKLGKANVNLIGGKNSLGIAIRSEAESLIKDLESAIETTNQRIYNLPNELSEKELEYHSSTDEKKRLEKLKSIERIKSGTLQATLEELIGYKKVQIERIKASLSFNGEGMLYDGTAEDDIIVDELHLPINKPVTLKIRSRDIIHSVFMPHFRSQMNAVPGLPTQITFTPIITTKEMRKNLENEDFDYYIICNKICGSSHFNMRLKVVVESEADYETWLKSQKPYFFTETDVVTF